MMVAPIIHTRTLYNDFLSGFLVRPEYFTNEDIDWTRKMIRASTANIDLMKGERYIVLDNGTIRIAGIVAVTAELVSKTNINIENKYLCDIQGRNIYAFIGICIKNIENHNIILSYDDFLEIFKQYVVPIFEDKVIDTQLVSETISLKTGESPKEIDYSGINLNNSIIYESTEEKDKKLFYYYLSCNKKNFSYCSNISKYQTLKDSVFDFITTTPNNIKRLSIDMENIKKNKEEQEESNYQTFKKKYYDRLKNEFKQEITPTVKKECISSIQNSNQTKEYILEQIYSGKINETEHFKIIFLNKELHSVWSEGKNQQPMTIIKKGD